MKRNCKNCFEEFVNENPNAHNVKFCSVNCRKLFEKYHAPYRQKDYIDRKNHERLNKYAPGKFQCPMCQGWYKALLHHVWQQHDMRAPEYKKHYGYNNNHTFISPGLKEIKREHVFNNGTVENLRKGKANRYVPGDKKAGRYERRPETLLVLKKQFKTYGKTKVGADSPTRETAS